MTISSPLGGGWPQQRLLAGDPLPPCEGKVIAADKLLKFVQRLRSSYVAGDGSLRALSDDWIVPKGRWGGGAF